MMRCYLHALTLFAFVFPSAAVAQELPLPVADLKRTEKVDFAKEIMPILKKNCLACHHQKEPEGGLVLETIAGIHEGGDSGKGIVPKDVSASLVFARARGADDEELMPPVDNSVGAKSLTPEELGLIKLWIEQGAGGVDMAVTESIDWQPIPESIRTVYAMDVAPDGQYAAIGRGNRVVILDLSDHTEVARLVDPNLTVGEVADVDLIQSVAFSPDAERIATGGFRTVRIWKKTSPPVDPTTTPILTAAGLVAVNADSSAAAFVNAIGDIEVWNLNDKQLLQTLVGHTDRVSGLAWAGATDRILSCDPSGKVVVWSASAGTKLAEFEAHAALIDLTASRSGNHAAALGADGKVHVFHVIEDGKAMERVSDAAGGITDATAVALVDAKTPLVIVASQAGGVQMLGLDNKVVRKVDHGAIVDALAVTGDQTKLATGGRDGKTRLWNIADGKPLVTMEGDPDSRLRIAAADRDALRQKAAVERLNKRTGELETLLTKENEVLKKATEEQKKATDALAAEEKKRVDAVTAVTATEAKIAKAAADTTKANELIAASNKRLAAAKAKSEAVTKEIEVQKSELASVKEAANKAQQQIAELTKAKNEAEARAAEIEKVIAQKQAAIKQAGEEATEAQTQIDSGNKMAADAKAVSEQATKELETQKKTVTTAEEAKKKSEAEVSKRTQALETAKSAQKRAETAVPAHKAVIQVETRRQSFLDQRLAGTQARITRPGNEVVGIAISKDDSRVATAHPDGSIRVYRTSDGQPLSAFHSRYRGNQQRVALAGQLVCGFSATTAPSIWSSRIEWSLERTIGSIDDAAIISDRVTALDFRQDGMSIAVGSGPPSRSGEVKVFSVSDGRLVRDFGEVHSDTVLGIDFSPDGRTVASAAADKTIRLLDIATGKTIRSLEGHTHHVLGLAWQDDGQTIASASADRNVKVWNTQTGEQRRTISGFAKEITAVAFVQTSNQIVTACADGQLRLSDTSNGKAIRTFNASGDFLFTLSVTPDGKKLLAGGQSGNVRIWTLADGKLIHETK